MVGELLVHEAESGWWKKFDSTPLGCACEAEARAGPVGAAASRATPDAIGSMPLTLDITRGVPQGLARATALGLE